MGGRRRRETSAHRFLSLSGPTVFRNAYTHGAAERTLFLGLRVYVCTLKTTPHELELLLVLGTGPGTGQVNRAVDGC